jgi:hypothetical protein
LHRALSLDNDTSGEDENAVSSKIDDIEKALEDLEKMFAD